ncbi:MAG: ribonuclease III [Polyangiaceae bacterium]|nr:ribonuclease III [Polyangiaceae bacterium]MCE7893568.1 ribonuclease III [Sorangiineae bacterium PRO1]MCL4754908.1 ribonuclease III [Myxococcales bacterium]
MLTEIARQFGLSELAPHLKVALTHPSFANEQRGEPDNQRLEFLGDAVLGLCASELLYERFPEADEGSLTRLRARLVNADALAAWARDNAIAEALLLGRGAESSGLRTSTNVLADAVEALVAAAYLDSGLEAARSACAQILEPQLEGIDAGSTRDPKSELQERVQAARGDTPRYDVTDSGGPAHDRWFEVAVRVGSRELGRGRGRSKRAAEFAAARAALDAGAQIEGKES